MFIRGSVDISDFLISMVPAGTSLVPVITHTHAGTEYVKRAGALYTTRVPLGSMEGAFCIALTSLNKAYARCEMYAPLPRVKV